MRPDLVLTGTFRTGDAVSILRKLGVEVLEFPPENSFDDIRANLRRLGQAIGAEARAEALVAEMDARLRDVPRYRGERPLYANYGVNGWTTGPGSLLADVAERAGFETLGGQLGAAGGRQVSLEAFLVTRPDLIDLGNDYGDIPALSSQQFRHPALRRLLAEAATVELASEYTLCGTMKTLEALDILSDARRKLG